LTQGYLVGTFLQGTPRGTFKMKREAGGIGDNVVRQDSGVALNNPQWQTVDRQDSRVAFNDPQWQIVARLDSR
jgi:hypothetical protein